MIHRVLVAVDATSRAPVVLRAAAELAKQFGATMVMFRAIAIPPQFPPAAATHGSDALGPKLLADGERDLGDLAAKEGIQVQVRVAASTEPWRAIVEAARETGADAIVIGSHGYHLLDRILGTNAARVADRAHCLVVVVHEPVVPLAPRSAPYRTNS